MTETAPTEYATEPTPIAEPEASADDIRRAYRAKSREHHPDKGGDLFAGLFEQRIAAAEQAIARSADMLTVIEKVLELTKGLAFETQQPDRPTGWVSFGSRTSAP